MNSFFSFPKKHIFHIYAAIVILFTSWVVYYSLPKPSYFKFVLLIWILYKYNKLITLQRLKWFLLFGIVFLRAKIPFQTTNPIFEVTNILLLASIFFIPRKDLELIFYYYLKILIPILAIGLIQHLFFLVGINIVSQITSDIFVNESKGYYEIYPLLVYNVGVFRFNSIFNEPGYLGTFIAFILVLRNFSLSNKIDLFLFFIAFFTLSLSFYFLIIIYIIIRSIGQGNIKIVLSVVIVFFILGSASYYYFSDNILFLIERLQPVRGGGISDSRVSLSAFEMYWQGVLNLNFWELLFGHGGVKDINTIVVDHVSWVDFILRVGLFFGLIYIITILKSGINNLNIFMFSIVFILAINHRPQVFELMYTFILALGLTLPEKRTQESNLQI